MLDVRNAPIATKFCSAGNGRDVPVSDIDVASSIAADLPLSRSDTLAGMVSSDAGVGPAA